jgi:Tfp pilus assembly protein PilF
MGKTTLAEKDLPAAIALTPKANYLIARSEVTKDAQPQAALNDVNSALELDPKNTTALNLRALIYGKLKFPDKEIEDLNSAINLNPLDMSFVFKRAQAYIHLKRWDSAMNDLQNALEEDPNNSTFYLARAYVYHKQGNDLLAQEDVKRAQFCNPDLPQKINLDSADTTSRVTKN